MYNSQGGKIVEGLKDGQDNLLYSMFRWGSCLSNKLIEISSFTKLGDDIAIIDTEVYIQALNDVGMFDFLENIDFTFQQSSGYFALDVTDSDFFNSNSALVVNVGSFIDSAKASFSYLFLKIKDIVFNFLEHVD